jgi:hypothetical protein
MTVCSDRFRVANDVMERVRYKPHDKRLRIGNLSTFCPKRLVLAQAASAIRENGGTQSSIGQLRLSNIEKLRQEIGRSPCRIPLELGLGRKGEAVDLLGGRFPQSETCSMTKQCSLGSTILLTTKQYSLATRPNDSTEGTSSLDRVHRLAGEWSSHRMRRQHSTQQRSRAST